MSEKTVYVTERDIQTLIQIARNYKETLDLIMENSKRIPFADVTGINDHYALYDKVKAICE